jgi:hypothetical protein
VGLAVLRGFGVFAGGREMVFAAQDGGEGDGPADGAGEAGEAGDDFGAGPVAAGEQFNEGHAMLGEAAEALVQLEEAGAWHGAIMVGMRVAVKEKKAKCGKNP